MLTFQFQGFVVMIGDSRIGMARGRRTKRGDVIAAAETLFLENGYAGTSMDAIANAAGVIKQTVYRYFASKEALFGAVMTGICARIFPDDIDDLFGEDDIKTTLEDFARRFVGLHGDPTAVSLFRVVLAEAHRFPELARAFMENGPRRVTAGLAAYLARQGTDGRIRVPDPHAAASYFLSMLLAPFHMGLCLGLRAALGKREIDRIVDDGVDVFLRAFPIEEKPLRP